MEHSFDIEVAKEIGVTGAILLKNIYFWVQKNEANNKHFADGYYWTYNSVKAFNELFPYLTEKQLRSALTKLEEDGFIITGNYNKSAYDRTKWYAITEKGAILLKGQMENTKRANENVQKGEPIPDINTNTKTNKNSLSKDKEGQAPKSAKRSYKEVLEDPSNKYIKDALVKFLNACKGRNYTPKVETVEKFAQTLRDNAKEDHDLATAMVDQSIDNGWKDIYPLKGSYKKSSVKREAVSIPAQKEDKAKNPDGSYVVF